MKKETRVNYICEVCNRSFTNVSDAETCEATCKAKKQALEQKQKEEAARKQGQLKKDKELVEEAYTTFQKILADFERKYPNEVFVPASQMKKSTPHTHSVNIPPFSSKCNGKCGTQEDELTEEDFEKIMLCMFPQLFQPQKPKK